MNADALNQTDVPPVKPDEPNDTVHTSRSKIYPLWPSGHDGMHGDVHVVVPAGAIISDVRYYSSARVPHDVPDWWNSTGADYPYRKNNIRQPLDRLLPPQYETNYLRVEWPHYFYKTYGGAALPQDQRDITPVGDVWNRFWNKHTVTWRYVAIEVDWRAKDVGH